MKPPPPRLVGKVKPVAEAQPEHDPEPEAAKGATELADHELGGEAPCFAHFFEDDENPY